MFGIRLNIENIDVKYTPSIRSIKFVIQPPYTPLKDENNSSLTVVDIFNQLDIKFQYEIILFDAKTQPKWKQIVNNEELNITDLDPNTEYNGMIHIRHSDTISKPCVFRVRTLSDNTWLQYLFGMIIFIIIFTFGTVLYFMYKYVKQHTIQQPTSLDFKGISHFQPLILNVEHALSPYDLSKIIQPGVCSTEISHHIQGMGEDQKLFNPTVTSYQQQSKMPPFQPLDQPLNGPSVGYAPQVIKNSRLRILGDNPSTLTYGLCIEESSHKANQGIKFDSFISNGHYKAQRPERTNKELTTVHQKEGLVVETIPQIQHLPLQEDSKSPPQESPRLLGEWRPSTVYRSRGSYRKQAEVLPSSLEVGQNAILEGGDSLLLSVPLPMFARSSCNSFPQDRSTAFCLSAWTDNFLHSNPFGFQITDCLAQESRGLKSEPQTLEFSPNILDTNQFNGPFPSLFNDLELQLQWDGGPEEATS
ncbi:interleukin-22 receptor subunit alpha-1 isoform X2 [Ahaetulla prasina]|uniref:interleukin-22 receptor subunit alpha-1 isoform X2 n=1 Tax=Ahaetulla prasina TaxID=499056 RepID=UPI002647EFBC|nr:interleukin-22 receptor subunit alpha-1 isoform X2 [Ahaetulla prasina]XP_058051662.1 interleukin-22 receptor subunit alpha-1 isoform X2 [Ahaetulla prasina]XP_058051663.1 interleukin-22 receptor subunit alpha-1 isoform X2 [Ahaetulla prasina]